MTFDWSVLRENGRHGHCQLPAGESENCLKRAESAGPRCSSMQERSSVRRLQSAWLSIVRQAVKASRDMLAPGLAESRSR